VKAGVITPAAGAKAASTKSASAPAKGQTTTPSAPAGAATKTGTPAQPVKTAVGATAAKKAPAAGNAKKVPATPKTAATKKGVATTKPAKPVKAVVEVKNTTPAPPLEKKGPKKLMGAAGRRDPFISPIRAVSTGGPTGNCTSGKRCLAIPELVLQGTVRDISGKMMAIVTTSNRRTYTLRENDQVFNGSVEKITSDSIIFREFVRDAVGRESAKEVVKKLSPTS